MNFWIIISIIASILLGIFSNWVYDILKRRKILPDRPAPKKLVVVLIICVLLILLVAIPSLLKKDDPALRPQSNENRIIAEKVDNSIVNQGSGSIIVNPTLNPTETPTITPTPIPTPGPSPTANAFQVEINKLVDYPITEQNTKRVNLDGYGPDEIITMGGTEGLPHFNVHAYLSNEANWVNVLDTSNYCDTKFDIVNLKQDGTKQLVIYGGCGTGAFIHFWIYEYTGGDTMPLLYEYPLPSEEPKDEACTTGVITVVNERMYITPFYHLGGSASASPQRCQVIWKRAQFKIILENTAQLPLGTAEVIYWRQDNQVIFSTKAVQLYIGQLIQFIHDGAKDPEPCTGELRTDTELLDFTDRFGVIRAKKEGLTSITISCGLDNTLGSMDVHITSAK